MIFIIDAHLPRSLCRYFRAEGHTAFHTTDLPLGNSTSDDWISQEAVVRGAVVISKDSDFLHSFLLHRRPPKLVLVKVGNLKLQALRALFEKNAKRLAEVLIECDLVELYVDQVVALD